jgi:hypothetical protein
LSQDRGGLRLSKSDTAPPADLRVECRLGLCSSSLRPPLHSQSLASQHRYGRATASPDTTQPLTHSTLTPQSLTSQHRYGRATASPDTTQPLIHTTKSLTSQHRYGRATASPDTTQPLTHTTITPQSLTSQHRYGRATASPDTTQPLTHTPLNENQFFDECIQLQPHPLSGSHLQLPHSTEIQIFGELRSYEYSQSSTIMYHLSLLRSDLILKSSEETQFGITLFDRFNPRNEIHSRRKDSSQK